MEACSFDESNTVLSKPEQMTSDQCAPLSVLRTETEDGFPVVVSCWKCTKDELEEINKTGRVWLMVYGVTMAPVAIAGNKPI